MNDYIGYIVTTLLGGGFGWIFTVRYTRTQAKADATKSVQDIYQEIIDDLKKNAEESRRDRDDYAQTVRDQREIITQLTTRVDELEKQVRETNKKLEAFQPYTCSIINCPKRQLLSSTKTTSKKSEGKQPKGESKPSKAENEKKQD